MASHPVRRSSNLTRSVVSALSERILNGEFHVGEKLPTEAELVELFGVSRTVVREALSRLQAAGLVETRHGVGTFALESNKAQKMHVHTESIHTMRDVMAILELRISLETEAAGLAALRRTEDQLVQLRDILDGFAAHLQKKTGSAVIADVAFHLWVAKAMGNPYFYDILKQLGEVIIPRARIDLAALAKDDPHRYLERVHREHEAIYNAIKRKDPDAARAAMRTHLNNSREHLRSAHDAVVQKQKRG